MNEDVSRLMAEGAELRRLLTVFPAEMGMALYAWDSAEHFVAEDARGRRHEFGPMSVYLMRRSLDGHDD